VIKKKANKKKTKGMPRTATHISKRATQDGVTAYKRENKIASKFTANAILPLTIF
jgi:hypothetical protein